jgi:hypothetical protein
VALAAAAAAAPDPRIDAVSRLSSPGVVAAEPVRVASSERSSAPLEREAVEGGDRESDPPPGLLDRGPQPVQHGAVGPVEGEEDDVAAQQSALRESALGRLGEGAQLVQGAVSLAQIAQELLVGGREPVHLQLQLAAQGVAEQTRPDDDADSEREQDGNYRHKVIAKADHAAVRTTPA